MFVMKFMQFWRRRSTSSTPTQHQTSLECPFDYLPTDDNATTSHSTLLHVLRKLCFYLCAFLIWGIAVVSFPLVLTLLLLPLPFLRLLQFLTDGPAYNFVLEVKLFIRNFTYFYVVFFINPAIIVLVFGFPELLNSGVKFLNVSLDFWMKFNTPLLMFCNGYHIYTLFKLIPPVFPLDHAESGLHVREAVYEIVDLVIISYLIFGGTVFPFREVPELFGLHTWKWFEVMIFVVVLHDIITLFTHLVVWLLRKLFYENRFTTNAPWYATIVDTFLPIRVLVYWANGVKHTIIFLLTVVVISLTWVLYIASYLEETSEAKKVYEIGSWTCLSLLSFAFLWLIKTCVILSWEASSVYNRLDSKILQAGKQLYFLGIIGCNKYDFFNVVVDDPSMLREKYEEYLWFIHPLNQSNSRRQTALRKKLCTRRKDSARDYLLMQQSQTRTIYGMRQAALHFLAAKDKLLEEKYVSNVLQSLKNFGEAQSDVERRRISKHFADIILVHLIGVDSYNDFKRQLCDEGYEDCSELIPLQRLEIWMERAHNNCLLLADTLSNAKEVADSLNKILSWLVIIASFIMWLRLTGLATTQELLVIASLIVIVIITFRDACKILIKGIMFLYVMHPFDVGDLCAIDEQVMEVKRIYIWKTTFKKIDTQEEVIYSNSYLFKRNIVNFKTSFDWGASIELEASSLDTENIKALKQEIEKYLNTNDKFEPDYYNRVEEIAARGNFKLLVKFRLNAKNMKNSSYNECFKEKCKLRSEFILHAQSLMDQIKIE